MSTDTIFAASESVVYRIRCKLTDSWRDFPASEYELSVWDDSKRASARLPMVEGWDANGSPV